MIFNLFNSEYVIKPDMIMEASTVVDAVSMPSAAVMYIQTYKDEVDPSDRLIIISPEKGLLCEIEVEELTLMLEHFPGDIIDSFPQQNIIISDCESIEVTPPADKNGLAWKTTNNIKYIEQGRTLFITLGISKKNENSGLHKNSLSGGTNEKNALNAATEPFLLISNFDIDSNNQSLTKPSRISETFSTPMQGIQTGVVQTSDVRRPTIVFDDDNTTVTYGKETGEDIHQPINRFDKQPTADKPSKSVSTISQPSKPVRDLNPAVKQRNLRKFCNIDINSITYVFLHNKRIVVINKQTGAIKQFDMTEIIANDMIGMKHEAEVIKAIGNSRIIRQVVKDIEVADMRHVMSYYEMRKNEKICKIMDVIDTGTLYVSVFPIDAVESAETIRDFVIGMHQTVSDKYEKLKSLLGSYSEEIYALVTQNGIGLLMDKGKQGIKNISIENIYEKFEDIATAWEVLSMLPYTNIINGNKLGIINALDVIGFADIPKSVIDYCANKQVVRDMGYSYDPAAKKIVRAKLG